MSPEQESTEARIARLEATVTALTSRTAEPVGYDRRALLRRGGVVLAGAAGALAVTGRAEAAAGDPLLLGAANDAGPAATSLSGGAAELPSLVLSNATATTTPEGQYAAAALRLVPSRAGDGLSPLAASAGDLASSGELLHYAHTSASGDGAAVVGTVYTSAFANHLAFVTPRRVLDTRPGPTSEEGSPNDRRTRVVGGSFDTSGRLLAGSALVLDLSELVTSGAGVLGNVTVVGPVGPGNLTAYPTPGGPLVVDGSDRPAASNVNFVRGQVVANFAAVGLGDLARISIYTTTTCHVLFDVAAFSVAAPFTAP